MQAVILAGGKGTRLKPYTRIVPKPLVPIDGIPILEIVLRQLKYYNFQDIFIAVNHLAQLIMAFFGDGRKLGINISYSVEDKPLGTAGPLALIENLADNFLVMNGDILTTINFKNFYNFHTVSKNDISIASHKKEVKIDLGVLEIDNGDFINYSEKPVYNYDVSTGIYIFNKNVINLIEKGKKIDMPDFMLQLKEMDKKIKCYQDKYFWLDIGRVNDYEEAVRIFKNKKAEFLCQ